MRTVRDECLDKLIIINERHLRRVLTGYIAYDTARRPHQGLEHESPLGLAASPEGPIRYRNVLGGIIRVYYGEAA
ncbi:transposase [Aggregatilinea lenta]|uniref:transposase n=1 Tax=Aggregatilinea lenta TaxID=913108 RepID=UPI000E5C4F9A|nr:transposase [Aggregatilinea lenta]